MHMMSPDGSATMGMRKMQNKGNSRGKWQFRTCSPTRACKACQNVTTSRPIMKTSPHNLSLAGHTLQNHRHSVPMRKQRSEKMWRQEKQSFSPPVDKAITGKQKRLLIFVKKRYSIAPLDHLWHSNCGSLMSASHQQREPQTVQITQTNA